jgi:hypothetical protein
LLIVFGDFWIVFVLNCCWCFLDMSFSKIFTASTTYVMTGDVSDLSIFMIGGGASGYSSHSGAGGAGYIKTAAHGSISSGTSISITIGAGGQRTGNSYSSGAYNGGATTVTIGSTTYTASGGTSATDNSNGGNGSSGGGGAGNSGFAGKGGSGGSNGAAGNSYGGGTGMGVAAFNSAVNPTVVLSAGAGGAAGSSSHAGGGGAGGIITDIVAYPTAENGGSSVSGKGGVGFGAGGGSGGYEQNAALYYYGGAGAPGMVYIYSTAGLWKILLKTTGAKPSVTSMGNFQGLLGNAAFKTMTVSTANDRKSFGSPAGFYEGFFTKKKITKLALVDGTSTSLTDLTGNTNYIIYDLVETSGEETMFQILNRLDTYAGNNQMANKTSATFTNPSVINFTAGLNGYSGKWSARSSASAFSTSTFPDKICVCGLNYAPDVDIQVFAAYWGDLSTTSTKGDAWRNLNPLETLWSLWGNDYHTNSTNQRISAGIQTSPGINASVSTYTGDVYLLALSSLPATLVTSTPILYQRFVSGASISLDISSNAGAVPRTHVSNNTAVVTIPTASTASASIAGPGKTTIKVTQPATGDYDQVVNNDLITIVVTGQGTTYTSETFPASFDMSGTNLSNSTFTDCTFTSTNLFGITVDASTNFSTCTFTGIGSGRITGKTARLPVGFTMI